MQEEEVRELLENEKEEMQENLRRVRGAAAVGTAAVGAADQPDAVPEPSSPVTVATVALAPIAKPEPSPAVAVAATAIAANAAMGRALSGRVCPCE